MLCRTLTTQLRSFRGFFTLAGPLTPPSSEESKKTPRPFDVDALVEAVQEADGIQVHQRGHITQAVLQSDIQGTNSGRRRRRKLKMGPREKYMFKKMRQRERERVKVEDPASDLTPLYEMTRPWFGFSSPKGMKQKTQVQKVTRSYIPEEESAILQIKKAILENDSLLKKPESVVKDEGEMSSQEKVSPNYFRSADSAEQEAEKDCYEVLAERLAINLHRAELESKHEFLKEPESIQDESRELEEALKEDPAFQQDALRLETVSKEMADVDQWVGQLRSFSEKHERVLDAMDPRPQDSHPKDTDSLGDAGHTLKQTMMESGINVEKLEKEAKRELKREKSRK